MMKVVWQMSAMSHPEIASLYFLNSKNVPTLLFLVFSEMNRSSSSLFSEIISREHVRSQHERDSFARLSHPV